MKATIFLIPFLIFLTGCIPQPCITGLYTKDGSCCTYVCDVACSQGYEEGTCYCECKGAVEPEYPEQVDTNIDDIFEGDTDIEPPIMPSP